MNFQTFRSWRLSRLFVVAVIFSTCLSSLALGDLIATWQIDQLTQYDYVAGTQVPLTVPSIFIVSTRFNPKPTGSNDYGIQTATDFGGLGDATIQSGLSPYVGNDPYGSGIDPLVDYASATTSDYLASFNEEFVFQGNTVHSSGQSFWAHSITLRPNRYSPTQGGTGTADFAYTEQGVWDYFKDITNSPGDFSMSFNQYWYIWDGSNYTDGFNWSGQVTLLSVVPEPATASITLLSLAGLALLGSQRRRRPG